jgi:hypothetical protein
MIGALVSAVVGPAAWLPLMVLVFLVAACVTWFAWRAGKRE